MRTPRDILLERHHDADPKLDQIRDTIVPDLGRRAAAHEHSLPFTIILKLWRELILPCRRTWAGLATVWVAIALFNLTHTDRNQQGASVTTAQSAKMRLVFQEQQRVLAELVGPMQPAQPAAPPQRDGQHPRSEIPSIVIAA